MFDRREERRRRCLLGGELLSEHGRRLFDCVIRNVSDGGAMMVFRDFEMVPAAFELQVAHWRRSFRGVVVWQEGERAGVTLSGLFPASISHSRAAKKENRNPENRNFRRIFGLGG